MISINYRDGRPIYEQAKENLRQLMVSGILSPGDKLTSVRELAGKLAINPNTIQRAYRELESEGYIVSVPGKGSFVCDHPGIGDARVQQLLQQLDDAVRELRWMGVSAEELCRRIEGGENHEHD